MEEHLKTEVVNGDLSFGSSLLNVITSLFHLPHCLEFRGSSGCFRLGSLFGFHVSCTFSEWTSLGVFMLLVPLHVV